MHTSHEGTRSLPTRWDKFSSTSLDLIVKMKHYKISNAAFFKLLSKLHKQLTIPDVLYIVCTKRIYISMYIQNCPN